MRTLLLCLLLIPSLATAKPPPKKVVDETIIRMPVEELEELREAEGKVREATDAYERYGLEEKWALLDSRAAKAWVDAGKQIVKALQLDAESAEAWARADEQTALAGKIKRAELNQAWREARLDAARAFNEYQGLRLTWGKAALQHLEADVDLQRMRAYDKKVGGSADAQVEIGKLQQALGKHAAAEGRARQKMDKAEHTWKGAAGKAKQLDPNAGKDE